MKDAYDGSIWVPEEGYEWVNAIPTKERRLGEPINLNLGKIEVGKPLDLGDLSKPLYNYQFQPCLIPKGLIPKHGKSLNKIPLRKVEVLTPPTKRCKPAYQEFFVLYKYLYEREKFMEAVLNFANRYGDLSELSTCVMVPCHEQAITMSQEKISGKFHHLIVATPLKTWEKEVFNFCNYFTLYQVLYPRPNYRRLKEIIKWLKYKLENGKEVHMVCYRVPVGKRYQIPGNFEEDPQGPWIKIGTSQRFEVGQERIAIDEEIKHLNFVPGDIIAPAKYLLIKTINNYLSKTIRLSLTSEEKMQIIFEGSLGLVWFQFAQLVAKKRKIIQCPYCGLFLDVTDTRLKAHPECKNKKNKEKYYLRLKKAKELYKQGTSVEEIAAYFEEVATHENTKLPKFTNPAWLRKTLKSDK